ncbi:trehalose 6-phosphate synthase [Inquilinus ginsengisoli]|uniref:alpha,alpha-trehalose-phosphate synthase (UDP-forming) n=1 Tax=Inquilinus ginsengisoli TaxID=363840 RepID=UPI003D1FF7D6
MGRLIVVSNRIAPVEEGKAPQGGLAVAVLAALKETGGVWLGWSGKLAEDASPQPKLKRAGPLTYAMLDLTPKEFDLYYNGHANSTLWPVFHYRSQLVHYTRAAEDGYRRVNAQFADALMPLLRPGDRIWVHDYQLIPLGRALRDRGVTAPIGFFLHTPFPTPEVLRTLPTYQELLRDLAAYDVVGLHTARDRDALLAAWHRSWRETTDGRVEIDGRRIVVEAFPISIETEEIATDAPAAWNMRSAHRLRDSLVGRDLIIGVDRLDYSKGLPRRFEAFRTLLERWPDRRGRVSYMQIAPPTRSDVAEYQEIRHQLESLAGSVNGEFADIDWVPLRYLNKSVPRKTLLGFYRSASVGLVTPMRDGMNLVAKEYVAAQDPEDPGVLVLSEFAGAAEELDAALIVNPFDVEGVAEALERALIMPVEERRERHASMMRVLRANDIGHWRRRFMAALEGAAA